MTAEQLAQLFHELQSHFRASAYSDEERRERVWPQDRLLQSHFRASAYSDIASLQALVLSLSNCNPIFGLLPILTPLKISPWLFPLRLQSHFRASAYSDAFIDLDGVVANCELQSHFRASAYSDLNHLQRLGQALVIAIPFSGFCLF